MHFTNEICQSVSSSVVLEIYQSIDWMEWTANNSSNKIDLFSTKRAPDTHQTIHKTIYSMHWKFCFPVFNTLKGYPMQSEFVDFIYTDSTEWALCRVKKKNQMENWIAISNLAFKKFD